MANIDVKGLKIQDILNKSYQEIMTLDQQDLKKLVNRLVSAGNKRLRRLKADKIGRLSPAMEKNMFSTRGKGLNSLRREFTRIKSFMKKKTSTISGFKKLQTATWKRLGLKKKPSLKFMKQFWKTYRKFEGDYYALFEYLKEKLGSETIQRLISEGLSHGLTQEEILTRLDELVTDTYEDLEGKDLKDAVEDAMDDFYSL